MKVAFRVDASLEMGSGHLMRCLTLAEELRTQGADVLFVCREHLGHMAEFVRQRGFEVFLLPRNQDVELSRDDDLPAHAPWLGCDWQVDAQQTRQQIQSLQLEWLVVDHYALDARWESELRDCCQQIMVIDDLADRQHDCDLLLDQTLGRLAVEYANLVPSDCKTVTGSDYALLRPEFAQWRERSLQRRKAPELRHILISLGGVDQDNVTGQVLAALKTVSLVEECQITVVMGAQAPHLSAVQAAAAQMPWLTQVRVNISTMAEVMAQSDLAIGAAGSSSWERCCLGLPTLLLVLAENQKVSAQAQQQAGSVVLLCRESLPDDLREAMQRMAVTDVLADLSVNARKLCDGLGARRVVSCLSVVA
ncbi:MAG: UDP-2,4-diacetamido-2,4,6-trideoxy-beta-L-altropyranose hydrolase [Gammaproteobacteria bacterium]|nr:UDP-2,4-diacetamido-2,4,6-trideoxy-beta-L-altropyranose hydrolase [Gammaproteobacteria bacterium]